MPSETVTAEQIAAKVGTALDLGLQVWRTTDSRERFMDAFGALSELVARASETERLREELQAVRKRERRTAENGSKRAQEQRERAERAETALRDIRAETHWIPTGAVIGRIRKLADAALAETAEAETDG